MFLKEIEEALKTKYQGISEPVIKWMAKKLSQTVTTAEQVKTAVDGVTLTQLVDGYADSRATEASQTAIRNYESRYGLKDGVKANTQQQQQNQQQQQQQQQQKQEDTPAWAQALIDSNKALSERMDKFEGARQTASRKSQFDTAISALPENLKKVYGRYSYDKMTDEEFSTLMEEVKTEVTGFAKQTQQRNAVFGRPLVKGNDGKVTVSEEQANEVAKAMHI